MFSFWERQSFIGQPDVIIIGSGIVGLSTAISLKEKTPSLNIMVLERGILPYGASTRNAGFACFGSASELLDDLKKSSEEEVFNLVEKRWKGLQLLRKRVGDRSLEYEALGGYELFCQGEEESFSTCTDAFPFLNKMLYPVTGQKETFATADHKIRDFQFENVEHLLLNQCEGQIDTGKMMEALLNLAKDKNVKILNGAKVCSIENAGSHVRILLEDDHIECKKVLIATNGFAQQFLPEEDVRPARAQVVITTSIENIKVKGSFHYDRGYYYFRNVGNRLLLGGGRNLEMETEYTSDFGLTNGIQRKLEELLKTVILPKNEFTIEQRWSGIMGLGNTKSPIVKEVKPSIFCAVRMGGMGVALGSLTGEEAAELLNASM